MTRTAKFDSIVFDVDDTISVTTDRNYADAKPIMPVIEKIRKLHENGNYIILHTARGQHSCDGDIVRIEAANRSVLEGWLQRNHVPYHELHFGKPLGALYVDDKACTIETFLDNDLPSLLQGNINKYVPGGSGKKLVHAGDKIEKFCDNSTDQAYWLHAAKELGVRVPKVYDHKPDSYSMDFVKGSSLYYSKDINHFKQLFNMIDEFTQHEPMYEKVPFQSYIKKVTDRARDLYVDQQAKIHELLAEIEDDMDNLHTFSHDDLTLGNVIVNEYGFIVLIDPNLSEDVCSNHLMDLAKVLMSVDFLYEEKILKQETNPALPYVAEIMKHRYTKDWRTIRILELACLVRLLGYHDPDTATWWRIQTGIEDLLYEL